MRRTPNIFLYIYIYIYELILEQLRHLERIKFYTSPFKRFEITKMTHENVNGFKILGKLPFVIMNYNVLVLFLRELLTVLFCSHKLPFCAQKLISSIKAVNSNGQSDNAL